MTNQLNNWRYDAPPKGEMQTVSLPKGKTAQKWVAPKIIIVTPSGAVTVSNWLHQSQRWNMMCEGQEPRAWQPWPTWDGVQS